MDIRDNSSPARDSILVYLDGSREGEAVLPFAASLAKAFGSKVILLTVTAVPSAFAYQGEAELSPVIQDGQRQTQSDIYLTEIANAWGARGLDVECITIEGSVIESILACAKAFDAVLIAISACTRNVIDRLLTKRTISKLIVKSWIPVVAFCHMSRQPRGQKVPERVMLNRV